MTTTGEPAPTDQAPRVLFDSGLARVETHPYYGAIIRGAVHIEQVGGEPAFVPRSPEDDRAFQVVDDVQAVLRRNGGC